MLRSIETVRPLDDTRWMGWEQIDPTTVYLLEPGQMPQEWGRLWGLPADNATSGERILWAGREFVAVAARDGSGPVENHSLPGEWNVALGNDVGFVISDGTRIMFSRDGTNWQPAADFELDWDTWILDRQASANQFALLLAHRIETDGAEHSYPSVMISANGIDWQRTFAGEPAPGREPILSHLRREAGRWLAVGSGAAFVSADGREWTAEAGVMARAAAAESEPALNADEGTWAEGPHGWRHLSFDRAGKLRVRTLAEVQNPPAPDVEGVLAQWAEIETRLHAQTDLAGFYRELVGLVQMLLDSGNAALGEAARSAAVQLVLQRADAAGLRALRPLLSDKAFADSMLLVEKGAEILRSTGPAALTHQRARRGTAPEADGFDPGQTRRNLLGGVSGSAYDLGVLHFTGNSLPRDQDISAFWVHVLLQLQPELNDLDSPEGQAGLLAAGSGVAAGNSLGAFGTGRGEASLSPERWARVEQAAAAGLKAAINLVETRARWRVDTAHLPEPVWPPAAASGWDEATAQKNRALFDQHVAFSRDVMAFRARLTPGAEPDRAAWAELLARHETLLQDPAVGALHDAYVRSAVAVAQLMTSDDVVDDPWLTHLAHLKDAMAVVAIEPEAWLFRARLLQWSGQLAEARRDAAIAVLLLDLEAVRKMRFYNLFAERTRLLALELSLPDAVLAAPQQGYSTYNLQVARTHAMQGKFDADDGRLVERLYANLGARLLAAWRLPDPAEAARAEADLYSVYGFDLSGLPYPAERLKEWHQLAADYRDYYEEKPEEALELMEELVVDAGHPAIIFQRALMLGKLRGPEVEIAALERLLAGWPDWKLSSAKTRLAELRGRQREADVAASEAAYAEAVTLFNRGEMSAGRARLKAATAGTFAALPALHLLAELEAKAGEMALAESHLQRALAQYPENPAAGARLAMFFIGTQRLDEAAKVLNMVEKTSPDAAVFKAVKALHSAMTTITLVPEAGLRAAQNAVEQMETLKDGPFVPEVFVISAQFKLALGDRAGALDALIVLANGLPYTPPEIWFQIAQLLVATGKTAEAKPYAQKAADQGMAQAQALLSRLP